MSSSVIDPLEQKRQIRRQAGAARRAVADRERVSRAILSRLEALPEYGDARRVLFYIGVRAEVSTRPALAEALASDKSILVPWCSDAGELELFRLESLDDLQTGRYGILEPRRELRSRPHRHVSPDEVDLVMVPGVAFDRRGGRLGQGRGYYDRLLVRMRSDCRLIGVAFECQMFEELPMQPHDVFMDRVVTEAAVYDGIGRGRSSGGEG